MNRLGGGLGYVAVWWGWPWRGSCNWKRSMNTTAFLNVKIQKSYSIKLYLFKYMYNLCCVYLFINNKKLWLVYGTSVTPPFGTGLHDLFFIWLFWGEIFFPDSPVDTFPKHHPNEKYTKNENRYVPVYVRVRARQKNNEWVCTSWTCVFISE